jgi:uncharacterized protein
MIHSFMINGRYFTLDVASGALHETDEVTFKILQAMENSFDETLVNTFNISDEEFNEVMDELRGLVNAGQLFTPDKPVRVRIGTDTQESSELTASPRPDFSPVPIVKALCLHIAHDCNLRCRYCFAGEGNYGSGHDAARFMPPEVGRKAIDFLIARSGKRRNLEVDFFGGEPMLNFDTVKEIVAYARSREAESGKRFRFTLTTNGTLLKPEHHAYINEVMDNVVLSIDGRPETHDRMRRNANGTGSYNEVLPKLIAMAESRRHERYYVRGTYTRHNLDFAADVLHLADAGFTKISVEPVVANVNTDYAIRREDVPVLCAEYEKLAAELSKRDGVRFFHFDIDMEGGPCAEKRIKGCGAGTEYLAVTPEGKLFPCHQFANEADFCMGTLDGDVTDSKISECFSACNVHAKPECTDCWAKYYCSGGCAANAYHTNGSVMKPDPVACDLQRKRIECAFYMSSR